MEKCREERSTEGGGKPSAARFENFALPKPGKIPASCSSNLGAGALLDLPQSRGNNIGHHLVRAYRGDLRRTRHFRKTHRSTRRFCCRTQCKNRSGLYVVKPNPIGLHIEQLLSKQLPGHTAKFSRLITRCKTFSNLLHYRLNFKLRANVLADNKQ